VILTRAVDGFELSVNNDPDANRADHGRVADCFNGFDRPLTPRRVVGKAVDLLLQRFRRRP
jgi:hypothetical protein